LYKIGKAEICISVGAKIIFSVPFMYETETKIVLIYILELEPEVLHTSKEPPNRVKNLMKII